MESKRLLAAWMVEERIEKLKEEVEFEQERLKAVVASMTKEELECVVDEHYRRKCSDYPLIFVYANSELLRRENEENSPIF